MRYPTPTIPVGVQTFEGGLNDGDLNLKENESDDLVNVEFDKFGSLIKRKGYLWLNPVLIPTTPAGALMFDSCGTSEGTALPTVTIRFTANTSTMVS